VQNYPAHRCDERLRVARRRDVQIRLGARPQFRQDGGMCIDEPAQRRLPGVIRDLRHIAPVVLFGPARRTARQARDTPDDVFLPERHVLDDLPDRVAAGRRHPRRLRGAEILDGVQEGDMPPLRRPERGVHRLKELVDHSTHHSRLPPAPSPFPPPGRPLRSGAPRVQHRAHRDRPPEHDGRNQAARPRAGGHLVRQASTLNLAPKFLKALLGQDSVRAKVPHSSPPFLG